jgi:hypothetical protein
MRSESEWVLERVKLYHLLQAEPEWSLRRYARELGHDLTWVRKWVKRIREAASITLEVFRSRSRAPKTVHARIGEEARQLVSDLRQQLSERFHRRAGAKTIAYGLQEYARTHEVNFYLPRSLTTITRILHERGCIPATPPRIHVPPGLASAYGGVGSGLR